MIIIAALNSRRSSRPGYKDLQEQATGRIHALEKRAKGSEG
jgi:hypothetical protein